MARHLSVGEGFTNSQARCACGCGDPIGDPQRSVFMEVGGLTVHLTEACLVELLLRGSEHVAEVLREREERRKAGDMLDAADQCERCTIYTFNVTPAGDVLCTNCERLVSHES